MCHDEPESCPVERFSSGTGSYVRTSAIDLLVDRFMTTQPDQPKQIVSLGAGTDTRYFRLRDKYPHARLVYHEIDFPANTAAKLASIQRHDKLHTKFGPDAPSVNPAATTYQSETYNVHALDLRTLAQPNLDDAPLPTLPNLSSSIPTVLLSEMCLVYLQPQAVSRILSAFLNTYIPAPTPVSLVLYEPILPNDAFGRTMTSNLRTRNIHLHTLMAYPELADQRARLRSGGFVQGARAADTEWLWRNWVSEEEKERVAGLEMLDEFEELDLLLKHYCVAWGWRDHNGEIFQRAWGDIKEQHGG